MHRRAPYDNIFTDEGNALKKLAAELPPLYEDDASYGALAPAARRKSRHGVLLPEQCAPSARSLHGGAACSYTPPQHLHPLSGQMQRPCIWPANLQNVLALPVQGYVCHPAHAPASPSLQLTGS